MSEAAARYGLTPPWDTDQAALNAAEILDAIRRRTGAFREDVDAAVRCERDPGERLLRVFVGADDEGAMRSWLLVRSYDLKGRHVPALCAPAPHQRDAWRPMYAHCARCGVGFVVLYPDAEDTVGVGMVVSRFGSPESDPWVPGDRTTALPTSGRWSDGPAGSRLLLVDPPTLGVASRG